MAIPWRRARVAVPAVLVCVWSLGTAAASAQEVVAASFDQLKMLARLGDTISVTDIAGRVTTGKLADLSSSSLGLLVGGSRREMPEDHVRTIRQQRHGSIALGAKWGFVIGAAFGVILLSAGCDGEACAELAPLAAAAYGGVGSGIGVGLVAMTTVRPVIYSKASPASATFMGSPVRSLARSGVAWSVRF